jgi:hypothetical protein
MRLIVIKQATELQALSANLFKKFSPGDGRSRETNQAVLEQVKLLNPHVDFSRIDAGTVLLLPDTHALKDTDSQSLLVNAFEDFVAHANEGFNTVALRMRSSADALAADRADVNAVLKIAAVKRQIESDPLLKKQLDEANTEFTDAQKAAQVAARQIETMQKDINTELAALQAMLK